MAMDERDDYRDDYRGDVWYEEWRRGMPEGSLSDERIDDGYYDGQSPESLVGQEQQRQQDTVMERRRAEEYEEWLRDQEQEAELEE